MGTHITFDPYTTISSATLNSLKEQLELAEQRLQELRVILATRKGICVPGRVGTPKRNFRQVLERLRAVKADITITCAEIKSIERIKRSELDEFNEILKSLELDKDVSQLLDN